MEFSCLNQHQAHSAPLLCFPGNKTEWIEGSTIVKDMLCEWGADLCTSFKEGLREIANGVYHFANKLVNPDDYSIEIDLFNSPLAKALVSVTSIPDVDDVPEKRSAIFDRKRVVLILEDLKKDAGPSKKGCAISARLGHVISVLNTNKSALLNIEEWAYVSTLLDLISTIWNAEIEEIHKDQQVEQTAYENKIHGLDSPFFNSLNLLKIGRFNVVPALKTIHREIEPLVEQIAKKQSQGTPLDKKDYTILRLVGQISKVVAVMNAADKKLKVGEWDSIAPSLEEIKKILVDVDNEFCSISSRSQHDFIQAMAAVEETGVMQARSKAEVASKKAFVHQRAIHNLEDIKLVSLIECAYLSEEESKPELVEYNKKRSKMGHLKSTSHNAQIGVATPFSFLAPSLSATVNGIRETIFKTDDECYLTEANEYSLGASATGKVLLAPEEILKLKISASGTGLFFWGDYCEWMTPQTCATTRYTSHIKESVHQKNKNISRYFSRIRVLATSKSTTRYFPPALRNELLTQPFFEDDAEVAELDQLKSRYDSIKDDMEKRLALCLGSKDQPEFLQRCDENSALIPRTDEAPMKEPENNYLHSTINMPNRSAGIVEASVIGHLEKLTLSAECGVGDGKEFLQLGMDDGDSIFKGSISGTVQRKHRILSVVRHTGPAERLADPVKANRVMQPKTDLFDLSAWPAIFSGLFNDAPAQLQNENDFLKEQIDKNFKECRDPICKSWNDENKKAFELNLHFSSLGFDVLNRSEKKEQSDKYYVSDEDFLAFLKQNRLDENLIELRAMTPENRRKRILSTPCLTNKIKRMVLTFNKDDPLDLINCFIHLKDDFAEYERLQAGMLARKTNNPSCHFKHDPLVTLRKFEGRYGASNPNQLRHRMQTINAYLIVHLMEISNEKLNALDENSQLQLLKLIKHIVPQWDTDLESIPENEKIDWALSQLLKKEMIPFEKRISTSPFEADKAYLKDHLYFREDIDFDAKETELALDIKFPFGKLGLKISHRKQGHTNIIRAGDYGDIDITIGGDIGNIRAIIVQVAPYLYENFTDQEFVQDTLNQLDDALNLLAPSASFGLELTRKLRFAKPDKFLKDAQDFSTSHYFGRTTFKQIVKIGAQSVAIPLGVLDLVLGYEYITNSMDLIREDYRSNTTFYFLLLFMHEYNTGAINKVTGKIHPDSTWKTIIQQKKAFKLFFINYANNYKRWPDRLNGDDGDIAKEINAMVNVVKKNPMYLPQVLVNYENEYKVIAATNQDGAENLAAKIKLIKQAIKDETSLEDLPEELNEINITYAKARLVNATKAYRDAVVGMEDKVEKNKKFVLAMQCYENFMHNFNPHWLERKTNSELIKPRPLALVEKTKVNLTAKEDSKAMLAERKQHALQLLMCAPMGMMLQYGSLT